MNNFRFSKIIAGVGPTLAKETVLSKVINMVDVFRITLSGWFDDNNKKYIDTIMKLDNSKTIMMETRGADIRVKNVINIKVKDKQKLEMEYSEYAQEHEKKVFIDAPFIRDLKIGQQIKFQQSGVVVKIKQITETGVMTEVVTWWWILQFDRAQFPNYEYDIPFLGERERKDILRGLEYGVHIFATSLTSGKNDVIELKQFLSTKHAEKTKIFAKIETKEWLAHFKEILETADGIVLIFDKIEKLIKDSKWTEETMIAECKKMGKPVIVTFVGKFDGKTYQLINETQAKKFCAMGADAFMLDTMLDEEEPLAVITELSEILDKYELKVNDKEATRFYENNEFVVRDYIIYNAYRATKEVAVRAIVSYSENGYSAAKLSSLAPRVPLIAFTKNDETYRYLNMLRWVRGYKISQSFSYENLKRVGKEMIRIIFKGNISLDDKIIIVQANEGVNDEKNDMINGIELYKFKNI